MSSPGKDAQALIRATGSQPRLVQLRGEWWVRGIFPLIVLRQADGATLLLLPDSQGRYQHSQSEDGVPALLTTEEAAGMAAQAYCLYPRPIGGAASAHRWRDLRFLSHVAAYDLRLALLFGVAVSILSLTVPLIAPILLAAASTTTFLIILLIIVIAAVLTAVFQLGRGLALLRAEVRIGALVQTFLWERLLRLPVPFFRQIPPGDLAARLDGLSVGRTRLVSALLSLTLNGSIAMMALGLLLLLDRRMGWLALSGSTIVVLMAILLFRRAVDLSQRLATRQNHLLGVTVGLVSGIAKLRAARAEARAFRFWQSSFGALRLASVGAARARRIALTTQAAFAPTAFIGIFIAAALGWWQSSGEMLAATIVTGILATALATMWTDILLAARAIPSFEQLAPILQTAPEGYPARRDPGTLSGTFELSDIYFGYEPHDPPTLSGISIRVTPGAFVAVVGPSGSGKSTLVRLLLGFDTPQQGCIRYDGQCLSELDLHAVRRQIGAVLQHATLIPGTIRSNILGAAPLTEEDAWQAADLAGITPMIQALPMRMNTIITESGAAFSGGERQRLLIARALARQPRILLLDEATSALDQRGQAAVMHGIARMSLTRFVIAHRISTIRHADWIYVLDQGHIVQQGSYDDLIALPGIFQDLARRQLLLL
ncbi:MAG: ATP-binding cassette domain-containing protein [Ardenticatenales bacterium]|nr:ATP-binding cassette domain-containing protein [Ardenticatenales bacterium]